VTGPAPPGPRGLLWRCKY